MALYAILASKNMKGRNNSIELHVGTSLPMLVNEELIEIQADCDELDFILRNFKYIPLAWEERGGQKSVVSVMKWFGDTAKFIYFNLRW